MDQPPNRRRDGRPTATGRHVLPEVSVRSDDPDEASAVGARVYYPHRVTVLGEPTEFEMDIEAATIGPLTLGWLTYRTQVRIETGELGQYQVNIPTAGVLQTYCGNQHLEATPQSAAVYRPDRGTGFVNGAVAAPMLALKIDRTSLEHQLELLLDRPLSEPIAFYLGMDVATGRGAQWWSLVRSLAADLADEHSLIRQPLVAAPFAHSVMSGLLLAAAHDHREELTAPTADVGSAVVRQARAFIESHADQPLTVADIATHVGIGTRGLQQAFHRSLGTTPMQYLRLVRVRHVHRDLRDADPATTTVAAVAARWGFLHQGRFAALYRSRYGVAPADTLRRSS